MTERQTLPIDLGDNWAILKNSIHFEFQKHKNILYWAFSIWFLLIWVVPLIYNPIGLIIYGFIVAMVLGGTIHGADVLEECEEFTLALPSQRHHIYLARLIVGLSSLLFFTIFGYLAILFSLPQVLWSVFVDSGFVVPYHLGNISKYGPVFLLLIPIALPFCIYSFSVFFASISPSPPLYRLTAFNSPMISGCIYVLGFRFETILWGSNPSRVHDIRPSIYGEILIPLLFVAGLCALIAGFVLYRRKEGVTTSSLWIAMVRASTIVSFVWLFLMGWVMVYGFGM